MFQIPNGIKITNAQERNIRKLSSYALNLPDDYKHFNMRVYCKSNSFLNTSPSNAEEVLAATCNTGECGTAGCLLGHGPVAGIKPQERETWPEYATRAFGTSIDMLDFTITPSREWNWCFTDNWEGKPKDGALRLLYLLDYGVPEEFKAPSRGFTRKVRKAYVIT